MANRPVTWKPPVVIGRYDPARPWSYSCGWCRVVYMSIATNETDASAWGERHKRSEGHMFALRARLAQSQEAGA